MNARRLHVVLNPAAGGGRARRIRSELERELRDAGDLLIVETDAPGRASALAAEAVRQGADIVIAVGGDGTIHEVANGMLAAQHADPEKAATLAVVPVGTGNDFAKMLDAEPGRAAAYRRVRSGVKRRIDAGRAVWDGGEEYFVNAFGAGIDTAVVHAIQSLRRLPQPLVYALGLARALARYRPRRLRATGDGHTMEREVMTVAVANGRCVAGSFRIAPDAQPDDGLLDLCLVERIPLHTQPGLAMRIVRGTHGAHPAVTTERAAQWTIEPTDGSALDFQLDGEPRRTRRGGVTLEVLPAALTVLAGAASTQKGDT